MKYQFQSIYDVLYSYSYSTIYSTPTVLDTILLCYVLHSYRLKLL